jgi:hypothetical protein
MGANVSLEREEMGLMIDDVFHGGDMYFVDEGSQE